MNWVVEMMQSRKRNLLPWSLAIGCPVVLIVGWFVPSALLFAGGAVALCYLAWRVRRAKSIPFVNARMAAKAYSLMAPAAAVDDLSSAEVDGNDSDALVRNMLRQDRYALLLRKQLISNLSRGQARQALQRHIEHMALVPEGEVVVARLGDVMDDHGWGNEDDKDEQHIVKVESVFLDRYPVTNRQYREFVRAGGYEQMAIWEPEIWPAVLDFVDRTNQPGPRHWRGGEPPAGKEDHPVTGISWFEAAAYARWVGKRLPTDAEWVKAGSWPVRLSDNSRLQRRFPWGDTAHRNKANLWDCDRRGTVPVDEFPEGVSVGGVYQLVGNVWEWTSSNLTLGSVCPLASSTPMKSVRGGAYDTYFDNQATCEFQSGDHPIARKHNIGFRCALSVCDVACAPAEARHDSEADQFQATSVEEPV